MKVWVVWSASGEYENFTESTCGVFATRELAEAHADQLRSTRPGGDISVVEEDVLSEVPKPVPYVCFKAHINPDGSENRGLGYERAIGRWTVFTNEYGPAAGRVAVWDRRSGDLYVEVEGWDPEAVATEYERLLQMARSGETTE